MHVENTVRLKRPIEESSNTSLLRRTTERGSRPPSQAPEGVVWPYACGTTTK